MTVNNHASINWKNIEEMDKFLETSNLPRLNKEEIKNINILTMSNKTESVILKTPNKQKFRARWLHR